MKVLILDQQTQLFVAPRDQWSDNAREAKDFAFTAHARAVAKHLQLQTFQVLFYFPDIDYRIVVCESEKDTAKVL